MKRIKRIALVVLLTVGIFSIVSTMEVSAQAAQDFTLVNKTGVEIYALYVTPHNANAWGDDILGADTLLANETLEISFSRKERAKLWDLRVEDEDGAFIEWENLNLLEISKVTLFYKNGKATAIVE
ncbi:MAG TPA: hypothetical protein VNB22_02880 [Pyrinomonadaceae bacterium]|nr:hypothetical protein [Pyrinomonadaceae bacterium]